MNVLLDTHIALWAIGASDRLPKDLLSIIENEANAVYYSLVSVWEIALKHHMHPDQIPMNEHVFVKLCDKSGLSLLQIDTHHIFALSNLKKKRNAKPHNDPFDRLLIAQAKSEELAFFTHDKKLTGYKEDCVHFI